MNTKQVKQGKKAVYKIFILPALICLVYVVSVIYLKRGMGIYKINTQIGYVISTTWQLFLVIDIILWIIAILLYRKNKKQMQEFNSLIQAKVGTETLESEKNISIINTLLKRKKNKTKNEESLSEDKTELIEPAKETLSEDKTELIEPAKETLSEDKTELIEPAKETLSEDKTELIEPAKESLSEDKTELIEPAKESLSEDKTELIEPAKESLSEDKTELIEPDKESLLEDKTEIKNNVKVCSNCSAECKPNSRFCNKCGTKLEEI